MLLNYGDKKIEVSIPPDLLFKVLKPVYSEPLSNPTQEIVSALKNPINSPPLGDIVKPDETICLVVNDPTRIARSDIFLPLLIEELVKAGIDEKDIFIVFATGSHRPLSTAEMIETVGNNIPESIEMYNHDCRDTNNLIFLGDTSHGTPVYVNQKVVEADRRIITGSVVHHFFAGFGGGRKGLIPGVAGWDTIQKNHSLMLHENASSRILAGNPVHEDLLEGALMVGADFIFNTLLNENKEIVGIFAGDMLAAHLAACSMADQLYGVRIEAEADLVVASCGGYPKDINLYQAHKALDNAIAAVKSGGDVIFTASCPEGLGSENFQKWVMKYNGLNEMEAALRHEFELGGHKAYTISRLLQKARVFLLSELPLELIEKIGFIPISSLQQGIDMVLSEKKVDLTYVMPQASLSIPVLD